jgi:hypothetical protein
VAFVGRWEGVALDEWQAGHGDASGSEKEMRGLRQAVRDDSVVRSLLPRELQTDSAAAPACRLARIECIEIGLSVPTYNMEVEDAACFAVAGGVVVHNCLRYLLAQRPYRAQSVMPVQLTSSSDYVLRREAEKVYRPDLTEPDPKRAPIRLPGEIGRPYQGV